MHIYMHPAPRGLKLTFDHDIDHDMYSTPKCTYDVELSLSVYQVRLDWLPLPCIALI